MNALLFGDSVLVFDGQKLVCVGDMHPDGKMEIEGTRCGKGTYRVSPGIFMYYDDAKDILELSKNHLDSSGDKVKRRNNLSKLSHISWDQFDDGKSIPSQIKYQDSKKSYKKAMPDAHELFLDKKDKDKAIMHIFNKKSGTTDDKRAKQFELGSKYGDKEKIKYDPVHTGETVDRPRRPAKADESKLKTKWGGISDYGKMQKMVLHRNADRAKKFNMVGGPGTIPDLMLEKSPEYKGIVNRDVDKLDNEAYNLGRGVSRSYGYKVLRNDKTARKKHDQDQKKMSKHVREGNVHGFIYAPSKSLEITAMKHAKKQQVQEMPKVDKPDSKSEDVEDLKT